MREKNEGRRGVLTLVMLASMSVWAAGGTAEPEGGAERQAPRRVGVLDLNFGASGTVTTDFSGRSDEAQAVVEQKDGKFIVVGRTFNPATGSSDFALSRYHRDGSLDTSFGTGGRVTTDFFGGPDSAFAAALQRDGKLVVAGIAFNPATNDDDFGLARYLPDGRLDPSFGEGGKVVTDFFDNSDAAEGVAIQPNGRIVVVGRAFRGGTSFDFAMARYRSDGRLDTRFGSGGKVTRDFFGQFDNASAVAVLPGGKLLVGGSAFNSMTSGDYALARFEPDGRPDLSFGTGGAVTIDFDGLQDEAFDLAVQPDQHYVLVGRAFIRGEFWNFGVARVDRHGRLDASFGRGGKVAIDFTGNTDQAFSVALQGRKILVAGSTHNSSTRNDDFGLIRLDQHGRLDPDFGSGGRVMTDFGGRFDMAAAVTLLYDERIVLAGTTIFPNGSRDIALALYLGRDRLPTDNLLRNSSFENGRLLPSDWRRDAYIYREDLFAWDTTESYRGERSVMISIAPGMPNDARWIQTVPVEPHTRYRLRGWIKTVDVAPSGQAVQAGANLSILDVTLNSGFTFSSPPLFGDNDWTEVVLEFDSGAHTQLTVAARLGMYSGTTTGTAWFDHIRLVKVKPCR
jgi:uncharacterized delta-60 repeat protein